MAEEACGELHQYSYIIQWLITALFFFLPTVPNLVPNLKWRNNSVTSLYTKAKLPHPFPHTPPSQHPTPGVYPLYTSWFHCPPIHIIVDERLANFWYAQRAYWELVSRGKNFFCKKADVG